jgi:hypothetical protein
VGDPVAASQSTRILRRHHIQSGRGTWPDDSAATDPTGTVRMPGTMRRTMTPSDDSCVDAMQARSGGATDPTATRLEEDR